MAQGANYQPVFKRVRSATVRSSPNNSATRLPLRPCTALGTSHPDLPPPPPAYTAPALHLIHPRLTGEDVPDTGDEKGKLKAVFCLFVFTLLSLLTSG